MTKDDAEKLYYKEEERKNASSHYIGSAITVMSILTGVLFFFFNSCTSLLMVLASISVWFHAPMILAIVSVVLLFIAIVYLLKSMSINHKYGYLPNASDLDAYHKRLLKHQSPLTNADAEYEKYLTQTFIELKDKNEETNAKCRKNIRIVLKLEVLALLGLILALAATFSLTYLHSISMI